MPYVRQKGNQLALVHGERTAGSGSGSSNVQQRVLFTIYSKGEALAILGEGDDRSAFRFESLLDHRFPELRFDWKALRKAIRDKMEVLPERYEYKQERVEKRFRQDLGAFARQLFLADPQHLLSSANLIRGHRSELELLRELISWRLLVCEQEENVWNQDTPYFWRFALPGSGVPPEAEELAAGYYEKQDYPHAKAAFELLTELFDGYAEGHNYLGLIALEEGRLDCAVASFDKTIELGRKLFPKRISKKRYWSDDATRPYMRGLSNLALALNRADRFDEALALCDRLENECGDEVTASWHRATICLNLGRWSQAASSAGGIVGLDAEASFLQAFALHASGERQEAVTAFLHAALNHPRTARMLLALRTSREPRGYDEISDHNAGVNLIRALHAYLARPPRGFRRFFTALVADPRVAKLLDEVRDQAHRFREDRKGDHRSALERMNQMRSRAFAEAETHRLRDLFDSSLPAAMVARP